MKTAVGILDYGVGNVASLKGVLQKLGYKVCVGNTERSLSQVEAVFLPGVGCFSYAMNNLRELKMDVFLRNRFDAGDINVIGICLGMQILFDHSEEGDCVGLGIIEGHVKRFEGKECHVGWNIAAANDGYLVTGKSGYYFNHSYYVDCATDVTVATSHYQFDFPVMVKKDRFYGVQFHPEKSQDNGLMLIETLVGAD